MRRLRTIVRNRDPRGRIRFVAGVAIVIGTVEWALQGSDRDIAGLALGIGAIAVFWAIWFGARLENRMEVVLRDVRRIADAIAPVNSAPMVKPGNWYIELDDGSSAERHAEIDGAVKLEVGDALMGTLYGRRWKIARVNAEMKHAVAVLDE